MLQHRPAPIAESILPYLDAYRKILYVDARMGVIDRLPARGTTMMDAAAAGIGLDIAACSDVERAYVYSHAAGAGSDLMALYFVKTFTDTERNTSVLTEGGNKFYTWPDVLKEFTVEFDDQFPLAAHYGRGEDRGVATVGRPVTMRSMVLGGYIKSPMRINHYLSDTAFPPSRFRNPQPIAGEIYLPYIGVPDNRIVALHGPITLPARPGSYQNLTTTGSNYSGVQLDVPSQFVPATNFTDWDEFTLQASQEFVDGLWHLVEEIIEPPEQKTPVLIYS